MTANGVRSRLKPMRAVALRQRWPISSAQGQLQALQLTVKAVVDRNCSGGNVKAQSGKGEMAQRSTITVTYCGG